MEGFMIDGWICKDCGAILDESRPPQPDDLDYDICLEELASLGMRS
jgi:hypothetical protein